MATKAGACAVNDEIAKTFLNDEGIGGVRCPATVFVAQCALGDGRCPIAIGFQGDRLMFAAHQG